MRLREILFASLEEHLIRPFVCGVSAEIPGIVPFPTGPIATIAAIIRVHITQVDQGKGVSQLGCVEIEDLRRTEALDPGFLFMGIPARHSAMVIPGTQAQRLPTAFVLRSGVGIRAHNDPPIPLLRISRILRIHDMRYSIGTRGGVFDDAKRGIRRLAEHGMGAPIFVRDDSNHPCTPPWKPWSSVLTARFRKPVRTRTSRRPSSGQGSDSYPRERSPLFPSREGLP